MIDKYLMRMGRHKKKNNKRGRHKARTYTSYIVCIVYVLVEASVIMYMYNMVNTFFILNFVLTCSYNVLVYCNGKYFFYFKFCTSRLGPKQKIIQYEVFVDK